MKKWMAVLSAPSKKLPPVAASDFISICEALTSQLIRLITDDDTRATMRTSGPVQAQSFSWATAAQSVLRQYAQLTQRDT